MHSNSLPKTKHFWRSKLHLKCDMMKLAIGHSCLVSLMTLVLVNLKRKKMAAETRCSWWQFLVHACASRQSLCWSWSGHSGHSVVFIQKLFGQFNFFYSCMLASVLCYVILDCTKPRDVFCEWWYVWCGNESGYFCWRLMVTCPGLKQLRVTTRAGTKSQEIESYWKFLSPGIEF